MSDSRHEVHLVLFSAAEVTSGFALAERICDTNGFTACITLIGESTASLEKQVESRRQDSTFLAKAPIRSYNEEAKQFVKELDHQPGLKFVLVAGLEKLDDYRKTLLRKCRRNVVCFETHPGLEVDFERVCFMDSTPESDSTWFATSLVPFPEVAICSPAELAEAAAGVEKSADLVVLPSTIEEIEAVSKKIKKTIEQAVCPVCLVRDRRDSWSWFWQVRYPNLVSRFIPQMAREQRLALSLQLETYSILSFEFVALICASTFLASFGLLQNSAAVIIGAMLVAPLMTPILGAGLSIAHGNQPLFWRSLKTITLGFVAALVTSLCFGLLVRFVVPTILNYEDGSIHFTEEMWSRTHPTAIDFLVGLVGGSAAAFARTRMHLADALAGAAIAAALVPPIATAGLHVAFLGLEIIPPENSSELSKNIFFGPVLLFVANMLTIMIGSSFVLWACGVRASHGHGRKEKWGTRMTFLLIMLTAAVLVWIVQHP
ncbi:MAG: DUF389 domain-containing protein [Planctomycetota bacterium]